MFILGKAIFRFVSLRFFRLFPVRFRFRFLLFRFDVKQVKSCFFSLPSEKNFGFNFNFRLRSENEGAPYSPVVSPTHGSTGVFHNTSLDLNYWHSMPLPFCISFLHDFRTFSATLLCPKNVPSSAHY